MSVKLLIDMNLSPRWVSFFDAAGVTAIHWSTIGRADAEDEEIAAWARDNDCVVFTNDLDFGTLLAISHARGPSVIQVRTEGLMPSAIGNLVLATISQHESELIAGAIIVIDKAKRRVRVLPI
jgi:predicted nuclease of predicted toxin-antitoxin system